MDGIIIKYFDDRGFGFIKADNKNYFFHISDVLNGVNTIIIGIRVHFDIGKNDKGEKAENVKIISDSKFCVIGNTRIKMSNIKEYGISKGKPSYKAYVYTLDEYEEKQESKKKDLLDIIIDVSMGNYREARKYKYILKKTPELVDVSGVRAYGDGIWGCDLDEPIIAMSDNYEYYDKWQRYEEALNNSSTEVPKKPFDAGYRHKRKIVRQDSYTGHVFASKCEFIKGDFFLREEDFVEVDGEEYLYVTTYQGDNFVFYKSNIDIKKNVDMLDQYFSSLE